MAAKGTPSTRRMRALRAAALGCVGAATIAWPAFAETLQDALVQAYVANPTLNAQRAATRATDEGVPQALSGYRPQVFGTVDGGAEGAKVRRPGPATGFESGTLTASAGVSVEQPLFNGYRTRNTVRQAESTV